MNISVSDTGNANRNTVTEEPFEVHTEGNSINLSENFIIKLIIVLLTFALLMFAVWAAAVRPRSAHEAKERSLETLASEIQQDIQNEDYDSAMLKTNSLYMTDGFSDESTKYWNGRREEFIRRINHEILENMLDETFSEIQADMENGKYEDALDKANTLIMNDGYSQDRTKYWDNKRKNIIKDIKSAQKEADGGGNFFDELFGKKS